MAVKISRNPLSFRSRSKELDVVVDASKPDLGIVRVKVCEIPKGLLQELRDDDVFYRKEVDALTVEIEACERRREEQLVKHRDSGAELADLVTLRGRYAAEVEIYRTKRKEVRRLLSGVQLTAIRWGVCDHRPEDFADDETGEGFVFHEEPGDYDGVKYRVASQITLGAYASAGLPLVQALFDAVNLWQRGEVQTPQRVWEEAKAKKESLQALIEAKLRQLRGDPEDAPGDPLPRTETTTKQTTTISETQNN
jgi:hypothetical protein